LVWGVLVVAGAVSEAEGAKRLLTRVRGTVSRWAVLWVDGGYEHRIEAWVQEHLGIRVEVVKRTPGQKGWQLLPKRWVAERTFGWLGRWRGLAKEYTFLPRSSEASILLAMIHLMLQRLTV
jgi:putative transposase